MALDFFAGCVGGCAGVLVGHPLDTIKVRIQTQDFRNPQYRGTLDCFKQIVKNESFSGLYKGMSSPLAGVAVVNAIVFGAFGNIQRNLPDPDSLTSHFIAGTAAGLVQSFVVSPMELVKTRIQIQKQILYKSPLECLSHIYKREGYRGIFRGLNITLLREGPGFGSYFVSYEMLTRNQSSEPISTFHMLMAGGTAGAISWFFAYPIDVIKSRIQVDGMTGPRLYKNSLDCFTKSLKAEGPSFMFRGITATLIRAFPTNAATWATVTWVFRICGGESTKVDSYQTFSEFLERAHLENIISAQVFKLPEYGLAYKSDYLQLTNVHFPKKHLIQYAIREPFDTITPKEERPEENQQDPDTKDSRPPQEEKNDGDDTSDAKIKYIKFQGDDHVKRSLVNKCEKEFSYFENFFVSLWKIGSNSFS